MDFFDDGMDDEIHSGKLRLEWLAEKNSVVEWDEDWDNYFQKYFKIMMWEILWDPNS